MLLWGAPPGACLGLNFVSILAHLHRMKFSYISTFFDRSQNTNSPKLLLNLLNLLSDTSFGGKKQNILIGREQNLNLIMFAQGAKSSQKEFLSSLRGNKTLPTPLPPPPLEGWVPPKGWGIGMGVICGREPSQRLNG